MDIHAPIGPTHSFKDFAVHILIVTIGILIALGLEGAREAWRESTAVAETRRSLQEELHTNENLLVEEIRSVNKTNTDLDRLLATLPEEAKTPAELRSQVLKLNLPGHFFRTTAWDSALNSGVLTHMDRQELSRFDDAYLGVKSYQELQKWAFPDWFAANAYFASHRTYNPAELTAGEEKLRLLQKKTEILVNVAGQFKKGLDDTIGTETPVKAGN